jgi:hypothetical protein
LECGVTEAGGALAKATFGDFDSRKNEGVSGNAVEIEVLVSADPQKVENGRSDPVKLEMGHGADGMVENGAAAEDSLENFEGERPVTRFELRLSRVFVKHFLCAGGLGDHCLAKGEPGDGARTISGNWRAKRIEACLFPSHFYSL